MDIMERKNRFYLPILAFLAVLLAAPALQAADRLPGGYQAEVLSVSADGSFDAAIRTWFGQVTIAKVRPRSVEAVKTLRECGTFDISGGPSIGRGKRVFLSKVGSSGGESGYVADVRHAVTAQSGQSGRAGLPVVLRGGTAASCRQR
jgi:hypothetical protein